MKNLTIGAFLLLVIVALVIAFFIPQAAVEQTERERRPKVFSTGGRREPGRARAAGIERRSPAARQQEVDAIPGA